MHFQGCNKSLLFWGSTLWPLHNDKLHSLYSLTSIERYLSYNVHQPSFNLIQVLFRSIKQTLRTGLYRSMRFLALLKPISP